MNIFGTLGRFALALPNALMGIGLFGLGITTTLSVSDRAAYAHYMPAGYALKEGVCSVQIWNVHAYDFSIRDAFMRCTFDQMRSSDECPAWMPIQWCEKNVRMLARAPQ